MNPFETAVSRVGFLILVQRCTYYNYKNLLLFECESFNVEVFLSICRVLHVECSFMRAHNGADTLSLPRCVKQENHKRNLILTYFIILFVLLQRLNPSDFQRLLLTIHSVRTL